MGANEPVGNTNFDFRVAGLSFQSESYAGLVVAGARAQLKGTGSINGAGGYGFMLSAVDGDLARGGGGDRVRVKIWELVSGTVVYDSQVGDGEDALAATEIRNGSIVIHK